jgi:hypothetical protein
MIARTIAAWFALMLLAIANGAFREAVLVPRVGSGKAHVSSTAILCILITLSSSVAVPWLNPRTTQAALTIGTIWLIMTLAFEFGFGHFVAHKSWSELLADYDLFAGRVWVFVPLAVFVAPYLAARARGVL